jgi:hypothetical protein
MRISRFVWLLLLVIACGGRAWNVAGAPTKPPDEQFRTGVEAGDDVYIWHCYENNRVVVHQFGSACFGTRSPVIDRGPCGAPLSVESNYTYGRHGLPDDFRWPGSPPEVVDAGAD